MVIPKDLQGFGDLASYWSLVSSTDPGGGTERVYNPLLAL